MARATFVVFLGLVICLVAAAAESESKSELDRIVGGFTVMIKDAKFMASLQLNGVHKCGGSIIHKRFILTAAHCLNALINRVARLTVRVGSTIWSAGGQEVGVKEIIIHPKYNTTSKVYDIGLLKLKTEIDFTDTTTVGIVTLDKKTPAEGRNCKIYGWGLKKENADNIPNMLQGANVTTISRETCGSSEYQYNDDIKETMMCAKGAKVDACQGDSGGPLVCENDQRAVVSFGKGCGRPDYPGVYALIGAVSKWIQKYIES